MAWITPVTNRHTGLSRMTYADMNRITGNINYLYDLLDDVGYTVTGSKISQDVWTRDDVIDDTIWAEILTVLSNVCSAAGYTPGTAPDDSMWFGNINNIESITMHLYDFARTDFLLTGSGVDLTTESGEFIRAVI